MYTHVMNIVLYCTTFQGQCRFISALGHILQCVYTIHVNLFHVRNTSKNVRR